MKKTTNNERLIQSKITSRLQVMLSVGSDEIQKNFILLGEVLTEINSFLKSAKVYNSDRSVEIATKNLSDKANEVMEVYGSTADFLGSIANDESMDNVITKYGLRYLSNSKLDNLLETAIFDLQSMQIVINEITELARLAIEAVQNALASDVTTDSNHSQDDFQEEVDDDYWDEDDIDFIVDFETISNRIINNMDILNLTEYEINFFKKLKNCTTEFRMLSMLEDSVFERNQNNVGFIKSLEYYTRHLHSAQSNYRMGFEVLGENVEYNMSDEEVAELKVERLTGWVLLILMTGYNEPFLTKARSRGAQYESLFLHDQTNLTVIENHYKDLEFIKVGCLIDPSLIGLAQRHHYGNTQLMDIIGQVNPKMLKHINKTYLKNVQSISKELTEVIKNNKRTLSKSPIYLKFISE